MSSYCRSTWHLKVSIRRVSWVCFELVLDSAKNYYEFLGLETTNPTEQELKKAFRQASRKYHPDKNTGGEDTTDVFLELKHAQDTLSHPFSKSAYDLFG